MASQKKIVIVALTVAAIMMMATVLATLLSTKTIPSSGTISAFKVDVYSDDGLTTPLTAIPFDTISAGYNTSKTVYIKNNAVLGGQSMSLSMTVTDWACTPANTTENVVTFAFNSTGTILAPTENCTATITLTALDNNSTRAGLSFTSININIIGTET
ncbi:MAG TPA: hypothetical protein VMW36_11035 [Patescibacteria group bacterium]|nr:hypothetical protein [Patescibacteria group bacterium]